MQRRDEDTRGMRGAEEEDERAARASHCSFTVHFDNDVDFPKDIIAFQLRDATRH